MNNYKISQWPDLTVLFVAFLSAVVGGLILIIIIFTGKNSEIKTPIAPISSTPIIQEKIVYQDKIIYAEIDRETWLRIVELDNKIFQIAGDGFYNLSLAITDISEGDYSNLSFYTEKQKDISNQLDLAKLGRANLLKQVGL